MHKTVSFVHNTLNALNKAGIQYCHFKSNEHLEAALSGETDLDLLFVNEAYDKVNELLLEFGYHKFKTAWFVSYPYVEDYIAISDGKIVHIHAHFKLILGESKVKSYILPWGEEILKNSVFLADYNIYTAKPVDEMLLLIVRTALKLPFITSHYQNKRDTKDATREFEWLKQRVTKKELTKLAEAKFGKTIGRSIGLIYNENINFKNIRFFYKNSKKELAKHRRYNYAQSNIIRLQRRVAYVLTVLNRKLNVFPSVKNHRTLNSRGIVVTLMGADGSGKSTQVNRLVNILSKKMDVRYIYMGSGNGPASWHRSILKLAFRLIKRKRGKSIGNNQNSTTTSKRIFSLIYFISLAFEKRKKLKRLQTFRNKGMICITDRYPQTQINGYNDGLHLSNWLTSINPIKKLLSTFEYNCYNLSKNIPPDLVIKLIGEIDMLSRRREEMSKEEIQKKQDGIKALHFDPSVQVHKLDASLDRNTLTQMILEIISKKMKSCSA